MIVELTIPGPPVPLARWHTRGWAASQKYREHVQYCAVAVVPHDWPDARYDVAIDMYFPDLRSRDDDNVEKALKDALNGVLWKDDNWRRFRRVTKTMALDRVYPRVEMRIEVVE